MSFKMKGFSPFHQTETKKTTTTETSTGEVCILCGAPASKHYSRHPFEGGTKKQYIEKNKPKKNTFETEEQYQIRLKKWMEENNPQ